MAVDPQLPKTPRGELLSIGEVRALDRHSFVAVWKTQSVLGNVSNNDGVPAVPRHLFGDLYASGDKTAVENSPLWSTQWVGAGPYRLLVTIRPPVVIPGIAEIEIRSQSPGIRQMAIRRQPTNQSPFGS